MREPERISGSKQGLVVEEDEGISGAERNCRKVWGSEGIWIQRFEEFLEMAEEGPGSLKGI